MSGGDGLEPIHYGSLYTSTDYKTNSTNAYLTVVGNPTEKLTLTSSLVFSTSKAEYDEVSFESPEDRTHTSDGTPELENANYDYSLMSTYSSLEYQLLQVSVGLEYQIQKGLAWTLDGSYADLTDDGVYVYGDESGSLYMIRTGIKLDF